MAALNTAAAQAYTFPVPAAPGSIIVATGKCKKSMCACPQGYFNLNMAQSNFQYRYYRCIENGSLGGCGHMLSDHENAPSAEFSLKGDFGLVSNQPDDIIGQLEYHSIKIGRNIHLPRKLDPKVCPRVSTVKIMWDLVQKVRVVHCRAPPTSGKTQLARLLQGYVTENFPHMQVIYLDWPDNAQAWLYKSYDVLIKEFACITWEGLIFDYSNILLICDEAQNSYRFTTFWNDFIKVQSQGTSVGPCVVLFSSWGSPHATAVEYVGSTPYLRPDQRVSIDTLYFTRGEFEDVIARVGREDPRHPKFRPDLVDHLFSITSGHPGCTRAVLNVLLELEPHKKTSLFDLQAALPLLEDANFFEKLAAQDGFDRGLPRQYDLEAAAVLQAVVKQKRIVLDPSKSMPGLERVHRYGWLHADLTPDGKNTQFIFPTEIHRMYSERILGDTGNALTPYSGERGKKRVRSLEEARDII